ncbi:hypothetical protein PHYSODRAFT_328179 [Phytophthora sojae]|uniref:Phospholipase D-like domain-containing protein n=1 Tax=Phytophthora sojae (strain P6497) TaxID=1094619 RepID=G4Z2H5_PHYSP|nr:hypothetical protein PHYSODRAFT_328179 [Phytophthora sojae]EGZ20016.1 hypothetical protein PHYSODRAFT_328179 [Phytophthora sojae]|eukprot:XP_009522733.1 hypothetical protein PHYSODRAFT_328179 [Phytophthora sojae]
MTLRIFKAALVLICALATAPPTTSADRRPLGRLRSQPLLKPTDWFPTEEELTASRGGAHRNDLSVFTSGNAIKPLTITKEYYDSVYDDLSVAGEGDRIMLAAWDSILVPLKPDVDVTGATSGYHAARDDINNLPASPVNGARATFIFDDRVRSISSSHHHKTLVIAANSSNAAGTTFRHQGWVDGELRIDGPAAKDVANNFLARWNSEYKPCQGLGDDLLDFENPGYDHLAPLHYAGSNTISHIGTQNVQIVRTFSCKYEHYNEFAPFGELSILHARIKAIKNAKNYIYIEDQYFILVLELLEALMEVIPRLQKIIMVAHAPVGQIKVTGYEKYFYEMLSPPEWRSSWYWGPRAATHGTCSHMTKVASADTTSLVCSPLAAEAGFAEKRRQEHELVRSPRAGRQCEQQEMDKVPSSGV